MEDDLLITNKYYDNRPINYNDNSSFSKLMNTKTLSKSLYSKDNPEFSQEKKIDRDIGLNIPEESSGLEQFIKLGMLEKRKKIKKTIINIDSKNRSTNTIYDKQQLVIRRYSEFLYPDRNRPVQFMFRKNYGYLLLEDNYIKTLENKQFIFLESGDNFRTSGLTNEDFIFNTNYGTPIFNILEYLYDEDISYRDGSGNRFSTPSTSLKPAIYNDSRKLYTFNVIKFEIPIRNKKIAINDASIGTTNTIIELVSNIIVGYSNSSHYRVSLGTNFSNIYAVRLLSTEIPNTNYTFNGSELVSNFGNFNLKTTINNVIKWIYKKNYINEPNFNIFSGNHLIKNNVDRPLTSPNYLQKSINSSQLELLDYENYNNNNAGLKLDSIDRQQSRLWCSNILASFDNYFDQAYIGNNTENNSFYYPNTSNILSEYLQTYLIELYGLYKYFIINGVSLNPNYYLETATATSINGYIRLDISANSNRLNFNGGRATVNSTANRFEDSTTGTRYDNIVDFLDLKNATYKFAMMPYLLEDNEKEQVVNHESNNLNKCIIDFNPFIVKFIDVSYNTQEYVDYTSSPLETNKFSFSVFKITRNTYNNTIDNYSLYMLPLYGDFIDSKLEDYVQSGLTASFIDKMNNGNRFMMVYSENLSNNTLLDIKNTNPILYNTIKQYFLESHSVLFPCSKYNIYNSSNTLVKSLDDFSEIDIYSSTDISPGATKTDISFNDAFINISGSSQINSGNRITISFNKKTILNFTYISSGVLSEQNSRHFSYNSITGKLKLSLEYYKMNNIELSYDTLLDNKYILVNNIYFIFSTYRFVNFTGSTNSYIEIDVLNSNYYNGCLVNTTEYSLEFQDFSYTQNSYNTDYYRDIESIRFEYSFNQNHISYLSNKCSIIRIYLLDNISKYCDFYLGSLKSNGYYSIKYKYTSGNIDLIGSQNLGLLLLEESYKYYIRETLSNYLSFKFDNLYDASEQRHIARNTASLIYQQQQFLGLGNNITDSIYNNSNNSIMSYLSPSPYYYPPLKKYIYEKNELSNISKIPKYGVVSIYERRPFNDDNRDEGIIDLTNSSEYIYKSKKNILVQNTILSNTSDKFFVPNVLTTDTINTLLPTDSSYNLQIYNYEKHPVYLKKFSPGKYTETNLIQYIDKNFSNIQKKEYDYSLEQFAEKNIYTRTQLLKNIYDSGSSKFTLDLDRNINYLKFTSYRRVFQTYSNVSTDNKKILYTNENFPYLYFRIPELSLISGSIIKVEGTASIDNVLSTEINTNHNIIVPRNYSISVRQIMPLPKLSYLDSNKNMFSDRGSPLSNSSVNNLYVDYINSAIKSTNIKDININYLVDRIFNIGESDYTNINKSGISNITNSKYIYNKNDNIAREHSFYNGNLTKSYINSNLTSNKYQEVDDYNGISSYTTSKKEYGIEYQGYSAISGYNNKTLYNEYAAQTGTESYVKDGLETSFQNNELFVKLTDVYNGNNYNKIGRITSLDKFTNENGNVSMEYDLFSDTNTNFKIGDIIIGLDTQTIGVILPYDYEYSNLISEEIKVLGIGAYILNSQLELGNSFFSLFFSRTNIYFREEFYNLSKLFIEKLNSWTIVENNTSHGFYIQLKTVPNTSRLGGVIGTNINIYIPEYFRFVEKENSPLSLFGLTSDTYFNNYNYFKDNLEPYETALINRSYLYRYSDKDLYLVVETKQNGNFVLNDTVYIENHLIKYSNLDITKDNFIKIEHFEPFSNFITKIETIYNTSIQNYIDKLIVRKNKNRIVNEKLRNQVFTRETNDIDMLYDYTYQLDSSSNKIPIPFKNNIVARKLDQNANCYNYSYYLRYNMESIQDIDIISNSFKFIGSTDQSGLHTSISSFLIYNSDSGSLDYNLLGDLDNSQVYILTISNSGIFESSYPTIDIVKSNRYVRNLGSNNFILDSSGLGLLVNDYKYWINIECVRLPYSVKTITYSSNNNLNYVSNYDTLGIFERLITGYIHDIYRFFYYDLNRANKINNKYNFNLFKNRIVKIKVCPIDNLGFSYEPVNSLGTYATSTNYATRTIAGNCRKLFPYHEKQFIKNYYQDSLGEKVVPLVNNYIGYGRPKQLLSNYDYDMKQFLPGMGVYLIENETINIYSGTDINRLPASSYSYTTSFLGYVLDTSVENKDEYIRDYLLNNSQFSKNANISNTIFSEYYIYLLLDPEITTSGQVDNIFDKLNKDYNHIVFDAEANSDYYNNPIEEPGITDSKSKYSYSYSLSGNTVSFGSIKNSTSSVTSTSCSFILQQNAMGNFTYPGTATTKTLTFYEDNTLNISISNSVVDTLSNLYIGNTIIRKKPLNKTLPNYSFQTRKAYATITSRPVFYSKENTGHKLFASGDIDYFYKNFLKNKTIINYNPIVDKDELDNINNTQVCMANPYSKNFKEHNFKEYNCHASYIDTNLNNNTNADTKYNFYATGEYDIEYSKKNYVPSLVFEPGDDIVITDSNKSIVSYSNNKDYGSIAKQTSNSIVIKDNISINKNIKIITGCSFPKVNFPNKKLIDNDLTGTIENTALLDYEYDEEIQRFDKNLFMAKTKGYNLDIAGNNSITYGIDQDSYLLDFYNGVRIERASWITNNNIDYYTDTIYIFPKYLGAEISTSLSLYFGRNIGLGDITLSGDNQTIIVKHPDLSGGMFNTYANYYKKDSTTFPGNSPYTCEVGIIDNAYYCDLNDNIINDGDLVSGSPIVGTYDNYYSYIDWTQVRIRIKFKNHLRYLKPDILDSNSDTYKYNIHTIPYRTFTTTNIDDPYFIKYNTVDNIDQTEKEESCIYLDRIGNRHYVMVYDPSGFIRKGDYIILDYGQQNYVSNSISSNKKTNIPYLLYRGPGQGIILTSTMYRYKVLDIIDSWNVFSGTGKRALLIDTPIVYHKPFKRMIVLNDVVTPFFYEQQGQSALDFEYYEGTPWSLLGTQPFTIANKWYTKIFYRGAESTSGSHLDSSGIEKKIIPNYKKYINNGGISKYGKFTSKKVYIIGMKGIELPFNNISDTQTKTINNILAPYNPVDINYFENNSYIDKITPVPSGYYNIEPHILEDFIPDIDSRNLDIYGKFLGINERVNNLENIKNIFKNSFSWISNKEEGYKYPYIVIEGLYLGYGGQIIETYDNDDISMLVNNDTGYSINKVYNNNNNQLLYINLPSYFKYSIDTSKDSIDFFNNLYSTNRVLPITNNYKNRNDTIPIELKNKINENILDNNYDSLETIYELFGTDGKVVKKKIISPYNLNPNNYILLTIPSLKHLETSQNHALEQSFAKILLPGESNRVLYNTFVGGSKIFYDNLFNNLNELEIAFLTNDGSLFDFNGSEHSFTIEITELIDKFENINPRFGNIEI